MPTTTRPLLFDSHAHLRADDQQRYPHKPMQRSPDSADAPFDFAAHSLT